MLSRHHNCKATINSEHTSVEARDERGARCGADQLPAAGTYSEEEDEEDEENAIMAAALRIVIIRVLYVVLSRHSWSNNGRIM